MARSGAAAPWAPPPAPGPVRLPVLRGAHVELRAPLDGADPGAPGEAAAVLTAATEDRASYRWTFAPDSPASVERYLAALRADQHTGTAASVVIRSVRTGAVVGVSRLLDLQYWALQPAAARRQPSVAEIGGTWLAASAQRTAVNTETKLLLLQHAFDTWQVTRVCLQTDARNERSRAAISRLGARFEGVRRAHKPGADGYPRDSAFFSVLADEWPAVRGALTAALTRPR